MLFVRAKRIIWHDRLYELIERRWGPALIDIVKKASWKDEDIDFMLMTDRRYFAEGPLRY